MKRKIQLMFVSLLACALLALSISAAYATTPETMTLTGTIYVRGLGDTIEFNPGNSDNEIVKIRDMPVKWMGDITGNDFYFANRLDIGDDEVIDVWVGSHFLEDAYVEGIGRGNLAIGVSPHGNYIFIKSGSGDLRSIRGSGTFTPVNDFTFNYEIVIQINPLLTK